MLSFKWRQSLSLFLSLCLVLSLFTGIGQAKTKNYEVLQNDENIAKVMVTQNGTEYIATMDKKTHEITFETKDEKYEVELEDIKTDKDGETYFEGKLIKQNQGKSIGKMSKTEIIEFNKSRKSYEEEVKTKRGKSENYSTQAVVAIPLILSLTAALEALLLTAAVITIGGLTYVLATEIAEHLNNNKKYDYFAAYLYRFDEGRKVVIGPGISQSEATGRVLAGADILGRTKLKAKGIFSTVTRGPEIHGPYPDYLYHYHGKLPDEGGRLRETSAHAFYPGR